MAQKSGNNVKPPVSGKKGGTVRGTVDNPNQDLTEQNQLDDAGPLATERKIGQSQAKGRPPLMKK